MKSSLFNLNFLVRWNSLSLNSRGSGVIVALLFLAVLSMVATTLVTITSSHLDIVSLGSASEQARLLAVSGTEFAMSLVSLFPDLIEDFAHTSRGANVSVAPALTGQHPFNPADIIGERSTPEPWQGSFRFQLQNSTDVQEIDIDLGAVRNVETIVLHLDNSPVSGPLGPITINAVDEDSNSTVVWMNIVSEDVADAGDIIRASHTGGMNIQQISISLGTCRNLEGTVVHEIAMYRPMNPVTFAMASNTTAESHFFSLQFMGDRALITGRVFDENNEPLSRSSLLAIFKPGTLSLDLERIVPSIDEHVNVPVSAFSEENALDPGQINRQTVLMVLGE